MFQCGATVTEGCSALNQHWLFYMDSRTFQILHFNIELTVVIASNTKRRRNVVLASVADSDTAFFQERSQNPEI